MRILLTAGVALVAVLLEARPLQAKEGPWALLALIDTKAPR